VKGKTVMINDIEKVYYSEETLHGIVERLGKQISEDYKDKNLLLVSVLKGSVIFMADLMRAITVPCAIDFMCVSSYANKTESSGVVKIVKDLDINLEGWDVLIVEDILDSGKTLSYIKSILMSRNPRSMKICTLLDKPERRVVSDVWSDYSGAEVPDEFVVGYGLDYDEKYRNLPFIGVLKREVYEK
jgi:hypoxanthine phosphoribosyltransferase